MSTREKESILPFTLVPFTFEGLITRQRKPVKEAQDRQL